MYAAHREGEPIPPGFALYNGLLIPLENFNQLNLGGATSVSGAGSTASDGAGSGLRKKLKLESFAGDMDESVDAWLDDTEMRFDLYKTPDDEQVPEAVLALASRAAVWGRMFIRETKVVTWRIFRNAIRRQFASEMADVLVAREMDNLAQTGSVKDYIAEHSKLCVWAPPTVDVDSACCRQIFMRNMKPYLYKLMDVGRCRTMADTYAEACNAEDKNRASNRAGQFNRDGKRSRFSNRQDNKDGPKDADRGKDKSQKTGANSKVWQSKSQPQASLYNMETGQDDVQQSGKGSGQQ